MNSTPSTRPDTMRLRGAHEVIDTHESLHDSLKNFKRYIWAARVDSLLSGEHGKLGLSHHQTAELVSRHRKKWVRMYRTRVEKQWTIWFQCSRKRQQ